MQLLIWPLFLTDLKMHSLSASICLWSFTKTRNTFSTSYFLSVVSPLWSPFTFIFCRLFSCFPLRLLGVFAQPVNGVFYPSPFVYLVAVDVKHVRWMFKCTRLEQADWFAPFLDIERAALSCFIEYDGPAAGHWWSSREPSFHLLKQQWCDWAGLEPPSSMWPHTIPPFNSIALGRCLG